MIGMVLISKTEVDWRTLLQATQDLLHRNIARGLDIRGITEKDLASYISCLGSFASENDDPGSVLLAPGSLLRHVSFSFLVICPLEILNEIAIEAESLSIAKSEFSSVGAIAIISGNLSQWRTTIINGSGSHVSIGFRHFCNLAQDHFEKMRFRSIFDGYSKKDNRDSTFLLIQS